MTTSLKILIAGHARSGTTGLFYKVRNSLKEPVRELFEVKSFQPSPEDMSVLAKVLIGRPGYADYASFQSFDKKIGIVRDPRDWLISEALYAIYGAPLPMDEGVLSRVVSLLKQKEVDPASASLRAIVESVLELHRWKQPPARETVAEWCRGQMDMICAFFDAHPSYFILKYEDFVHGRIRALEDYLGFILSGSATVDPKVGRVARTKSEGDWRNWCTPEDVSFFRPLFSRFMSRFGYADDWRLPLRQQILPQHASGYVERLLAERNLRGTAP